MDDKELIALQNRYKNALLYKQEAKIHNLYEQLSKEKIGSEDFFHQAEQWAAECHELAKKAIEAVQAGATRDSLAFDELSTHAIALGGNAKTYFCAAFDHAIEDKQNAKLKRKPQKEKSINKKTEDIIRTEREIKDKLKKKISWDHIHSNSIPELAPAPEWTILFDETGSRFNETAFDNVGKVRDRGKMVALVVPQYTVLPHLRNFHATESLISDVREKLKIICNSRCGLVGIPVNGLQCIHAEQWFACIETILDLILRLLPVDGETVLRILVEQRGNAKPENSFILQKTCDDCLFHLSRTFPERSKAIKIKAKIITKDKSPYNGYADAIAFSWSSPNGKWLLKETGWENTCLINHDSSILASYIDIMERENRLSPEEWEKLLNIQSKIQTNSLAGAVLRNLGEMSRYDVGLWQGYMQYVVRHLNSKAINLYTLGQQVSWLKQWQPEEGKLLPQLRLIWLTVKLAEENHKGITNSYPDQRAEFNKLSLELFLEDAPFACNAALHLAVSYTNEFDFEGARSVLSFWDNHPAEVPGLQYYGQLLSSHGQHEAFMGNSDAAVRYFNDAIDAFERLSDPDTAQLDIAQTRTYLITVLMDAGDNDTVLQEQLKLYYGTTLEDAALSLATSDSAADKYRHHILLRYFAQNPSKADAIKNYFSKKAEWQVADGHPWEMIEFYRAMLCDDQEEKLAHLRKAYDIAKCGGLTLQVIAAVILGSIYFYDESVKQEFEKLVQYVRSSLPKLGERGKVLERQLLRNIEPLDFAKLVLPFNFR